MPLLGSVLIFWTVYRLQQHSVRRVRELEQSRAHLVDDSAARLRRIERDLHDGAAALRRPSPSCATWPAASHPPVLDHGIGTALSTLAAHSSVPVEFVIDLPERSSAAIETIAYFCAAELLTNVANTAAPGMQSWK